MFIDNHKSYYTLEFVFFANKNNFFLYLLMAHLAHYIQLLNIKVIQFYSQRYYKIIQIL